MGDFGPGIILHEDGQYPTNKTRPFYPLVKLSGDEPIRIVGARTGLGMRRFVIPPDVIHSVVDFALHVTQVI